jgi:hypothetical protein
MRDMRLFKIINIKISHKENVETIFQRIQKILEIHRKHNGKNWFYLADPYPIDEFHKFISASGRVIKNSDEFSQFLFEETDKIYNHQKGFIQVKRKVLSNLVKGFGYGSNPNESHNNVDYTRLAQIAKKIPRSYPFDYAVFIFDEVDWYLTNRPIQKAELIEPLPIFPNNTFLSSSITFINGWDINHRYFILNAIVEVPLKTKKKTKVELSDIEVRQLLEEIGPIESIKTVYVPSKEEYTFINVAKDKALKILNQYKSFDKDKMNLFERRLHDSNTFPYNLPSPIEKSLIKKIQKKKIILETFTNYCFEFNHDISTNSVIVLEKKTKLNNLIRLEFYLGVSNSGIACSFRLMGLLWEYNVDLPYRYDNSPNLTRSLYPIEDKETLLKVLKNFSSVVNYMENNFVKEIELIHGDTPEWYIVNDNYI